MLRHVELFDLILSDNRDIEDIDCIDEWTTEDIEELMSCLGQELAQRAVNLNAAEEYYGHH